MWWLLCLLLTPRARAQSAPTTAPIPAASPPSPSTVAPLPYDCMSGICLNEKRTAVAQAVVTVGERYKVLRDVEVCGGVVVMITLTRAFQGEGFDWTDMGAVVTGSPEEGSVYFNFVREGFTKLGWIAKISDVDPGEGGIVIYENANVQGTRAIGVATGHDFYYAKLAIATTQHPNRDELCTARDTQGL